MGYLVRRIEELERQVAAAEGAGRWAEARELEALLDASVSFSYAHWFPLSRHPTRRFVASPRRSRAWPSY